MPTKKAPKYDPNGRFRVLRPISHPQAKHPDGCIRPERDGENVVVNLAHHADNADKITLLVDQLKAFEYLGPAKN